MTGSSPLARGLLRDQPLGTRVALDHPRSRGVYTLPLSSAPAPVGSSPLARGLRHLLPSHPCPSGIIPARAGFTAALRHRAPDGQDHPRSRRVYITAPLSLPQVVGSSPLARGLLSNKRAGRGIERIIPARAGFTDNPAGASTRAPDHPRSRGVYWCLREINAECGGSSPLARGLLADE